MFLEITVMEAESENFLSKSQKLLITGLINLLFASMVTLRHTNFLLTVIFQEIGILAKSLFHQLFRMSLKSIAIFYTMISGFMLRFQDQIKFQAYHEK